MSNAVNSQNAHLSTSSCCKKSTILLSAQAKAFSSALIVAASAKVRLSIRSAIRSITIGLALALLATASPTFSMPSNAQGGPGISSPAAGSAVSGIVPIMGTAVIEPFQRYELYIKQEPNGDDAYIYLSGGTQPVTDGQLGVVDSGAFAPGTYSIRLRVVKLDGNYAEYFAPNISLNQGPAPTPTSSEPTPTPIPTATFTPAPQPTPIVGQVTQPEIDTDSIPPPTPEPVAAADTNISDSGSSDSGSSDSGSVNTVGNLEASQAGASLPSNEPVTVEEGAGSITSQLGEVVALDMLREQFLRGMRFSAFAFILIGLIFLVKSILGRLSLGNR